MEQTLTIGMAHHNDYNGVYFSIQDIRKELIFNGRQDLLKKIEFVVVENDPNSKHANELKNLSNHIPQMRIIDLHDKKGTSVARNKIIEEAKTNFVLVMDCHVLLCPLVKTLENLFTFMEYNKDTNDLYTGPLVYDNMRMISTHFNDEWRSQMWGTWGNAWQCVCESFNFSIMNNEGNCKFVSMVGQKPLDKCEYCEREFPKIPFSQHEIKLNADGYSQLGQRSDSEPFEVFGQGLGVFFTKKNTWLGFNDHARGFGGEECYIHEKYRKAGRKTMCLPFLKWLHRFGRPDGVKYELTVEGKVRNYILEFKEIGLDMEPLKEHFTKKFNFPSDKWDSYIEQANAIYADDAETTQVSPEDLAEQIKILEQKLLKAQNNKKPCSSKKCCKR